MSETKKSMNENRYVWLEPKEYVAQMGIVAKTLYYLGILKQKRFSGKYAHANGERPTQIYTGGYYRSLFGLRWWNPLTWIFVALLFCIGLALNCIGSFFEVIKEIRGLDRQTIRVSKSLQVKINSHTMSARKNISETTRIIKE